MRKMTLHAMDYVSSGPVVGSPPTRDFSGPWFRTQLTLSLVVGVFSILTFSILRPRWSKVYMARAIHADANDPSRQAERSNSLFGWIMPTLRTSNLAMLSTVGLDAVVFLDFLKTSFYFFTICAAAAALVLMPVNFTRNGSTDSDPGVPDNSSTNSTIYFELYGKKHSRQHAPSNSTRPGFMDLVIDPQTTITLHLLFTYIFSLLALYMLHRNFQRFLASRQLAFVERSKSLPARTVIIQNLPDDLREEGALKVYLEEQCKWPVERVSVVKKLGAEYEEALRQRTRALDKLEEAHWQYGGQWSHNTALEEQQEASDWRPTESPSTAARDLVVTGEDETPRFEESDEFAAHWSDVGQSGPSRQSSVASRASRKPTGPRRPSNGPVSEHRPRTRVPNSFASHIFPWLGEKVDAITYWTDRFEKADAKVASLKISPPPSRDEDGTHPDTNSNGAMTAAAKKVRATGDAFVTFRAAYDAQVAAQVVHYPHYSQCRIKLAPHPDDLVWPNVGMPVRLRVIRDLAAIGVTVFGLLFWSAPVAALASLLSFQEIEKIAPWLARAITASPALGGIVQTTLPSTAIIIFNASVPYLLEILCYYQGFRSKTDIERSLLKKYTLFLLVTVLFIFLAVSTFLALIRDLASSPEKIPRRLAQALIQSNARAFFMSYVMLQGIGLIPFQLLNFGTIFIIGLYSLWAKTPRDYAALYGPVGINYGMSYPPAILVFIMTLVYAVMSPLILVFGAIYFASAFLVFKYKLLHVFKSPASASGEAWPATFVRLIWGVVVFQLFMTGLFAARGSIAASSGMVPLLAGTIVWSWMMHLQMRGLSRYTPLSMLKEGPRAEDLRVGLSAADEESPLLPEESDLDAKFEVPWNAYVQPELSTKLRQPWLPK